MSHDVDLSLQHPPTSDTTGSQQPNAAGSQQAMSQQQHHNVAQLLCTQCIFYNLFIYCFLTNETLFIIYSSTTQAAIAISPTPGTPTWTSDGSSKTKSPMPLASTTQFHSRRRCHDTCSNNKNGHHQHLEVQQRQWLQGCRGSMTMCVLSPYWSW